MGQPILSAMCHWLHRPTTAQCGGDHPRGGNTRRQAQWRQLLHSHKLSIWASGFGPKKPLNKLLWKKGRGGGKKKGTRMTDRGVPQSNSTPHA